MSGPDNNKEGNAKPIAEEPIEMEWTCHPVKRRPLVSFLVTLFIIVITVAIYYTTDSRAFTILALVVLLASLAKFYLPTTFRFTAHQVAVKTTTMTIKRPWNQFRSFYPDKNGVLLSPFVGPSRLENFRGLYLMFNNNREEVIAEIKRRIDEVNAAETAEREANL